MKQVRKRHSKIHTLCSEHYRLVLRAGSRPSSPTISLPAAAKFTARSTKRILAVTTKYVMYVNKSLILTLTLNPI